MSLSVCLSEARIFIIIAGCSELREVDCRIRLSGVRRLALSEMEYPPTITIYFPIKHSSFHSNELNFWEATLLGSWYESLLPKRSERKKKKIESFFLRQTIFDSIYWRCKGHSGRDGLGGRFMWVEKLGKDAPLSVLQRHKVGYSLVVSWFLCS